MLDQSKWDISKFLLNPVVLWAHKLTTTAHSDIGRGANIVTEAGKVVHGNQIYATAFISIWRTGWRTCDGRMDQHGLGRLHRTRGWHTRAPRSELLPVQFQQILSHSRSATLKALAGLNIAAAIVMKGPHIFNKEETSETARLALVEEKAEQIGDHCELERRNAGHTRGG